MNERLSVEDLTILLVEPSGAQRRIIMNHLASVGVHKVDGAGSGGEALEMMQKRTPDLVVSAMYFDDMTGSELVETMRRDTALAEIPFMLVSSERHPHNLEPVRQAGVIAILPKPFEVEDLRKALANTLAFIEPEELSLEFSDAEDLRALIVDDSGFSRRFLHRTFSQLGLGQVEEARNGSEAVALLQEQTFDLVVTDYNMPEMDGQELVDYIRNQSTVPGIPVLMVTCETDDARLSSVRQSGVSALCDKPFNIDTVRHILGQLLS